MALSSFPEGLPLDTGQSAEDHPRLGPASQRCSLSESTHALPEPVVDALRGGTCLRLVLSRKRKSSDDPVEKVVLRPIRLGESLVFQVAKRAGGKEFHENLPPSSACEAVESLFGDVFLDCHCFTPEADWTARIKKGGHLKLNRSKPSRSAEPDAHDRGKQYLIPEGEPCPFLVEVGVMNEKGRVRSARYAKFRQVNRFLELVDDVLDELPDGPLHVVDYGCGKSYLTFALHHLLHTRRGREVHIQGLDLKEDVVADCNRIARQLDCEGLSFEVGHIAQHDPGRKVDLAVSLHACDTATDDALLRAVSWDARAIFSVPCCQHELFSQIGNESLGPITAHGLLKERFSSLATDGLRTAALELAGYRTQIVEFVSLEHTAKNLMIRAVKRAGESDPTVRRAEYESFKTFLGLDAFRLDTLAVPGDSA